MKDYKEFQFAWLIFIIIIPIQIFLTYLYINKIGDRPLDATSFTILNALFVLTILLFYGMTIKIDERLLTISFGIGLIRKRIEIARIKNVETVKNPWYYGWGIRIIPKGMLYNISGTAGIELKFKDTERLVRIGTKNSTQLKQEITRFISS